MMAAPARAAPDEPVILVLGDSLSAGYGIDKAKGWVNLLAQRLESKGFDYRVVNAAISGDTTRGGLDRLPTALDRFNPKILIVELGGNDGLRGIQPSETRRNLSRIVELGQGSGAKVLLVGVRMPPNYGPAFTQAFEQTFRDVAKKYGISLVPKILAGIGENRELMQSDGIHPIAEAQPKVLDNIWPELKPLLDQ